MLEVKYFHVLAGILVNFNRLKITLLDRQYFYYLFPNFERREKNAMIHYWHMDCTCCSSSPFCLYSRSVNGRLVSEDLFMIGSG